jgi:hypothetical protein
MSHNLINLLGEDRVNALRRDYFLRLAAVAIFLLALLTIIHGIFLFPSYLSLSQKYLVKQTELAEANAKLEDTKQNEVTARLSALKGDATYLARLAKAPSASAVVRAVLLVPHTGIHVSTISYASATKSTGTGKMMITGVAATREALRAFDLALSNLPFVANADLPISAYAQESNINFTVTLTGPLSP